MQVLTHDAGATGTLHRPLQTARCITMTKCGDCGNEIDEPHNVPYEKRKRCPSCGSTSARRLVEGSATVAVRANVSSVTSVERGLNDVRLAVLGILVSIAVSVGFGVEGAWWVQTAAAAGTFLVGALLLSLQWSRHLMMDFMHRITGH
jgi:hypothetical protein